MPSELHEHLSKIAARWAKKQGFPIVATGLGSARSREVVDLIAFRSSCSLMIESKVSRSDFKADFKKPERHSGGVGTYRFYITPVDLIAPDELPKGWGLLFCDGNKIIEVVRPKGNLWPHADSSNVRDWDDFRHQVDHEAERSMLFSITRRLAQKQPILN